MQLHLHDGNDEQLAMRYWVGETGLKDANFHRTFISPPVRVIGRITSPMGSVR